MTKEEYAVETWRRVAEKFARIDDPTLQLLAVIVEQNAGIYEKLCDLICIEAWVPSEVADD